MLESLLEITYALRKYPSNGELYFMLGNYYRGQQRNNQAYLCYEQAACYCEEQTDLQMIWESMEATAAQLNFSLRPVSIVILAQLDVTMLRGALQSIYESETNPSYEILVVDNEYLGKELDWVNEQEQTRVISLGRRAGFAESVNAGIKMAGIQNDIYLMGSDVRLMPNALFWLRMCLYERETVGAAGGVSNQGGTLDMAAALALNVPDDSARENRIWLDSFSMLIKRKAMDEVGFFEGEADGHLYSCMDYGMKLTRADYESVLCYNSVVWRLGGNSSSLLGEEERERLKKKWKFDVPYYTSSRTDLLEFICQPGGQEFRVLEVGCGCGAMLSVIRRQYPNARVYGIELVEDVAAYGTYMADDIIVGDIETMELPYEENVFDYIIFGDVLEHLRRPEDVVSRMKRYLSPGGRILASIPNVMNIEVIVSLLKGNFTYREEGLLDRTHIHMFTLCEIRRMFENAGFALTDIRVKNFREGLIENSVENEKMIEALYQIDGIADKREFEVYQYLIEASIVA